MRDGRGVELEEKEKKAKKGKSRFLPMSLNSYVYERRGKYVCTYVDEQHAGGDDGGEPGTVDS